MKELLTEKKFWLTVIPMVSAVAMYVHHALTADQLANALTAGFGVLVLAISHEENGAAQGPAADPDKTVKP